MKNLKAKDFIAIGLIISAVVTEFSKNIIAIPLILLWIMLAIIDNKENFCKYFLSTKKVVIIIYLWIFISLILYAINNAFMTSYEMKNIFRIAINLLIFGYYLYYGEKETLKIFLYISVLVISLLSINTIIQLIKYPTLSRILTTDNPEEYEGFVNVKFIGSYGFAYGLMFIIFSLISTISKKEKIKTKLIKMFLAILFIVTIIYEQFMLSILLLIFAMFMIMTKSYNIKKLFINSIIVILIIFISTMGLSKVLQNIAKNIDKYEFKQRLYEMSNLLETGDLDKSNDLNSRIEKYRTSIETFLKDPLAMEKEKKIGGHSELLDEYSKYGLIIASITVAVFIEYMKFIKQNFLKEKHTKDIWFISEAVFIIYSIINTSIFIISTIMVFLIVPLILKVSEGEEKNESILDK